MNASEILKVIEQCMVSSKMKSIEFKPLLSSVGLPHGIILKQISIIIAEELFCSIGSAICACTLRPGLNVELFMSRTKLQLKSIAII